MGPVADIQFEVVKENDRTWIRMITWVQDPDTKAHCINDMNEMEYSPRVGEYLINTIPSSYYEINRIFSRGIDGKSVAGKARKPSSIANKLVEKLMEKKNNYL